MRRTVSVILFALGGWMLTGELLVAFFDFEPGLGDSALMIAIFALLAIVPLLLGAWASPGRRWKELGLTILIAVGAGLLCAVSIAAIFLDPGAKPFLPPMPRMSVAPLVGVANLVAIAGLGGLLYRNPAAAR
jgi:hypothetical protein